MQNAESRIQNGEADVLTTSSGPLPHSSFCIHHSAFPPAHPVRDRLWLAGVGVLLFLLTLIAGTHLANPQASLLRGASGDDFLPSYMAGTFVRQGRPDLLMNYPAAVRFQAELRRAEGLERHGRTGPWLNPPFYALLFAPLSAMPYWPALWAWAGLNALALAGSVLLLCRMLPRRDEGGGGWRAWGLVPLLVLCSMPLLQALVCLQNTFLSLLLLCGTVAFWRAGRGFAAGLVAGLLLFKPQLAAVVAAVLVCTLGRRALLGLAVTGTVLLLLTVITMPGALGDYLFELQGVMPWLKAGGRYHWERQVTFQGFWRLLIEGPISGPAAAASRVLWITCAAATATALAALVVRLWRAGRLAPGRDRVIAATVVCMPLVMPYYMDYDLLLLAVPAVLFAADVCRTRGRMGTTDRVVLAGWVVLFPWLFVNAAVGGGARVSLTVPLLATLGGLLIARAWREEGAARATERPPEFAPGPLATAA